MTIVLLKYTVGVVGGEDCHTVIGMGALVSLPPYLKTLPYSQAPTTWTFCPSNILNGPSLRASSTCFLSLEIPPHPVEFPMEPSLSPYHIGVRSKGRPQSSSASPDLDQIPNHQPNHMPYFPYSLRWPPDT